MSFVIFACIVSAVLLVIFSAMACSRLGAWGVGVTAVLTGLVGMCLMMPAVGLQALFTLIMAVVGGGFSLGHKSLIAGSVVAAIASFAIMFASSSAERQRLAELREEYPLVDVSNRLAYESRYAARDARPAVALAAPVAERLEQFEVANSFDLRTYQLERLHTRAADEFALVVGFGPVRMLRIARERIELPERVPRLPLPRVPDESTPSPQALPPLARDALQMEMPPAQEKLYSVHAAGAQDFLGAARMGYVASHQRVAGFQPHAFSAMPRPVKREIGSVGWQVVRLDLISLLRHENPVAYISENLPKMDELRDAPTRPLDAFERYALVRVRADEDFVMAEMPGRIQMLGSLRAGKQCLECHDVQRGELLGAFSYRLMPASSGVRPPREVSDEPQAQRQRDAAVVGVVRVD